MKPKPEEFDHLVRQHLQDTRQGGGDWDMPSDSVWDAVAERIRPEKKRRWGFWWVLGGVSLLIMGILWVTQQKAVGDREPLIQPSSSTLQKNGMTDARSATSDQAFQNPETTARRSEAPAIQNQDHLLQASSKTPASANNIDHPATAKATNHQPFLHPSTDFSPSSDNTAEYLSSSEAINNSAKDQTSFNSSEAPELRLAVDAQFLLSPGMYLEREATIPQSPFASPHITRLRQPGMWSLAATLSPSLGTRHITVPNAQPRVRRNLLLQQEEPTVQVGFGISALREISSRWSLGLGAEYASSLLKSSLKQQIRYTRAGEMLNARGNYENRFRLNLNTSYGDLSTDVVLERSSDAQIEENSFINLSLETSHTLQELRFPLSLYYRISAGTWQISCYAGLSAHVLVENALTFRAVQSLDSEIVQMRTMRRARLSGSRTMTVGYQFGVAIEMPFDRHWSLLMGPSVSGSLEPVYQNRQVRIYPFMADIDLGVWYRF